MPEQAKRNFTGGELDPALHMRADLQKFQNGLAGLRNFTIQPQGGVQNRAGFEFIANSTQKTARTAERLISFEFNKEQAYILEFGNLYMRVIRNGGHVLETADTITGATQANPVVLSVVNTLTNGDEIFVAGIVGMTELNSRRFIVANVTGTTVELSGEDGTSHTAYVSGGTAARIFELVTPYVTALNLKFTQSADIMTITDPLYAPRDLSRTAHDAWTLTTISFVPTIAAPANPNAVIGGTGAGTFFKDYEYVMTVVDATGQESVQSAAASVNSLSLDGTRFIRVSWDAVAGSDYFNVYKAESDTSDVYGWIGESKTLQFKDFNLQPDMTDTPPIARDPFPGVDDFPATVSYYQQRQIFGRTNNNIQTFFATQSGNFKSMNLSRPVKADDSIERTIAAKTVNEIRHFVDLNKLLILTSGGVWLLTEGSDGVLTPSSIGFRQQAGSRGASDVQPVIIGDTGLYVQLGGRKIRDLGYSFQSDSYSGNDVSLLAAHLFKGRTVVDNAYAEDPDGIVWYVMSDGALLGLTYLKEHAVWGWHRHDTDGLVKSVAVIPNGPISEVYILVERTIQAVAELYIERLEAREFTVVADAFFVDSGLTYDSVPATTITGLDHLEGEIVVALADGNVVKTDNNGVALTVTNGAITLATAASKVHIGLAYISDLETLDVDAVQGGSASARGKPITVAELVVKVKDSRGGLHGPSLADLQELPGREVSDDFAVLPLETTEHRVFLDPQWSSNGHIFIRQDDPLPLSILGIVPDVDEG